MSKSTVASKLFLLCLASIPLADSSLSQEPLANIEWSGGNTRISQLEDSQTELQETFVFKNTGSSPLAIDRVVVSCGCTAPAYTKDIIAPGAAGEITLKYGTKVPGRGKDLNNKVIFSTGASAVMKWSIQNSPNPSKAPVTPPPVSHPLVEWTSTDPEQVKTIKIRLDTSMKVLKITGTDKVQAKVVETDLETGEATVEFKKITDQPFWGAMTIEFENSSAPPFRVNVRSLR